MPNNTKFTTIYIGKMADFEAPAGTTGAYSDIDTARTTLEANYGQIIGQTYTGGDMEFVEMTAYHLANDSLIGIDSYPGAYGGGAEGVEYLLSDGTQYGDLDGNTGSDGIAIDNEIRYNVTAVYRNTPDGPDITTSAVVNVFQTDSGDVFIQEYPTSPIDGISLVSVTFDSLNHAETDGVVRDSYTITGATLICFTAGTLIRTERGEVAVERLAAGDLVVTKDRGLQPIRWTGARYVSQLDQVIEPRLRPVTFVPKALGEGQDRPLQLSRQHRVLMRSKIAADMFGEDEVLIPAHKLEPLNGVSIEEAQGGVTYVHLLLEHHEIIYANGTETESMLLAKGSLAALTEASVWEIERLFSDKPLLSCHVNPARYIPKRGRDEKEFVARLKELMENEAIQA